MEYRRSDASPSMAFGRATVSLLLECDSSPATWPPRDPRGGFFILRRFGDADQTEAWRVRRSALRTALRRDRIPGRECANRVGNKHYGRLRSAKRGRRERADRDPPRCTHRQMEHCAQRQSLASGRSPRRHRPATSLHCSRADRRRRYWLVRVVAAALNDNRAAGRRPKFETKPRARAERPRGTGHGSPSLAARTPLRRSDSARDRRGR